MQQLVARDFKVKYKRSVLGVIWSLLNPLLTMLVLYFVFSNIFGGRIQGVNYAVYLISGLVMFNYFSESSMLAMSSVVGNFSLINKVYIPKYIFPLSKTLFIGINFLLTLIPMYAIILITGSKVTFMHLLLPYPFLCLFMFTLGVGLFMAAFSVFFRDMFYIYNIILMLWFYLTPIMYDINGVSPGYQFIMKFNPLYHFINFARTIILYNDIPSFKAFLICFAISAVTLLIGAVFFKWKQDRFIYYI